MKNSPKFTSSRFEMELISKIADRALSLAQDHPLVRYPKMTLMMDVEAAHCNGCPLDLNALLAADDFTFAHDIFGIARHINRKTGELEDCFVPRCALQDALIVRKLA